MTFIPPEFSRMRNSPNSHRIFLKVIYTLFKIADSAEKCKTDAFSFPVLVENFAYVNI